MVLALEAQHASRGLRESCKDLVEGMNKRLGSASTITDMKQSSLLKAVLLISGTAILASGCVYRERTVYTAPPPTVATTPGPEVTVTGPPPAPAVVESQTTIVAPPDPTFVWVGGAWVWGVGGWVWAP